MATLQEANKELVHRLYATLMAKGDTAAADEIPDEGSVDHNIPGHAGVGGRHDLKAAVLGVRGAFPDVTPELHQTLAEGDLVSVRVAATGGTHRRAVRWDPPSGKRINWNEIHIFACRDGRIVEHWRVFDMLGILQQLGAVPMPG